MNAPNPVQSWMQAGQQWACSQQLPRMSTQVFNTNGIYMPPPGLTYCIVKCLGGGGAGGRVSLAGGTTPVGQAGGGGGTGAYARTLVPAALVAGGVAVTVGVGGVGNSSAGGAIINGGASSFGPLCMAPGGQSADMWSPTSGTGSWGPGIGGGGWGGVTGVGDYVIRGNDGTWGLSEDGELTIVLGGRGYSPPGDIGGGSWATTAAFNGQSDTITNVPGPGCGGTGGVANTPPTGVTLQGQPGGPGRVVVEEYCFQPISAGPGNAPTINIRIIHDDHPHGCGCGQCQQSVGVPASAMRLLEPSY